MHNLDLCFQGMMRTTCEAALTTNLPLSTIASSPHGAMSYSSACPATFTVHMERLFFTAGQLFPVSFMTNSRLWKTTCRCSKHWSLAQALPERAEAASSFPYAEGGQLLCFSHQQLYSVLPHKGSCLSIRSYGGKTVLKGSLEEYGATLELVEGQRI